MNVEQDSSFDYILPMLVKSNSILIKKGSNMTQCSLSILFVLALCLIIIPLKSQPLLDLPELVTQSVTIVRARVIALSAQWIEDQNGKHIYTTAQLEPITAFKGTAPASLTYIGGTVDTITEYVSDVFILQPQDEAFYFLPAHLNKFTTGKISIMSIREGVIRKDDAVIKAAVIESALRTMIKTPSVKMNFKDLSKNESELIHTRPLQNKMPKLSKATSLPDLRPFLIWNSSTFPIIVRKTPAASPPASSETDSAPVNDNDSTLISFSVANYGSDAAGAFFVKIYIDAQLLWTENISSLSGGFYTYPLNRYVASLSAGTHTLKMVIDPDHTVIESDRTNNEYSRLITVAHTPGVPSITSISPSSVSAGTGSSVTMTGTGFGAVQGSGVVEFFYQSGHSKIIAPVIFWSDTQIECTVPIGTVDGYPASASSGPVTVRTASGVSGGFDVTVTFAYGGVHWGTSSIAYKINENYAPLAGEGAAVQDGFITWNNAGSNFSFQYGGATSITGSGFDGTNAILWGTTSSSLATNYYWSSGSILLESDIVFDNTYPWGVGSDYDIQSIVTHELGHSLSLRDQYGNGDLAEIMYGQIGSGTIKRNLTTAEIAGIQWIYGILPVELTNFTAAAANSVVMLLWQTATEVNNYGFDVQCRVVSSIKSSTNNWEKIGFVPGNGTSNISHKYSFTDQKPSAGTFAYRLKQIDHGGAFKYSQEAEVTMSVPNVFALNQNYPNPFNPSTSISFSLPTRTFVSLKIFDLIGKEVATLVSEEMSAGSYAKQWNASTVSSGVYFYQIRANNYCETKKLTLLK